MRITLYENEIKDAIIRTLNEKFGNTSFSREDVRLQNTGIGTLKLSAEIETEVE